MENPLPKSIQERAIVNVNSGMSFVEAIKEAFAQEEKMIYSLLNGSGGFTREGSVLAKEMACIVYLRVNANKSLKNQAHKSL